MTPGIHVTVFRRYDLPLTFRVGSLTEAKSAAATCDGGWWNGYRVDGAMIHEITLAPEVIARSAQAFPRALGA